MKRLRFERLSSQWLATPACQANWTALTRTSRTSTGPSPLCASSYVRIQRRRGSTAVSPSVVQGAQQQPIGADGGVAVETGETQTSEPTGSEIDSNDPRERPGPPRSTHLPSPPPSRALNSAKLAALHARLSLSKKIPIQTLARALIDPSADAHPKFNNQNLAYIGSTLLNSHVSEFLITRYPRLPMTILFAAMKGYAGPAVLHQVARAWGVEAAAAPGDEVDPGYLQFDQQKPTLVMNRGGYVRAESYEVQRFKWRRGLSSRVMYDDAFGEMVPGQHSVSVKAQTPEVSNNWNTKEVTVKDVSQNAHANFVRSIIGAVYLYCGREAAKSFVRAHFLSRKLDLEHLFEFKIPTRELARLCAREDFEPPVARLESETGRLSRTPVFVVGIYSGRDKLGEGAGASLDSARVAASINALKAWYLYSPGEDVGVPSDTFAEDAAPWKPAYVDIGEIIS